MPDEPQDTLQERHDAEDQQLINTDPMRAPQNAEERRVVAPDPEKVAESERQPQDDARE